MAEFCECGSLVIGGRCSNKSCTLKGNDKPAPGGKSTAKSKGAAKSSSTAKSSVKVSNPRRASKVITYNLYETEEKEPES